MAEYPELAVVDVETTGFSPKKHDRILAEPIFWQMLGVDVE